MPTVALKKVERRRLRPGLAEAMGLFYINYITVHRTQSLEMKHRPSVFLPLQRQFFHILRDTHKTDKTALEFLLNIKHEKCICLGGQKGVSPGFAFLGQGDGRSALPLPGSAPGSAYRFSIAEARSIRIALLRTIVWKMSPDDITIKLKSAKSFHHKSTKT